MPDMHTAIPCTGSTADQAVSTIHVQLGAAKHLTRPLTDKTRQNTTRQTRQDKTRHDKTRQDKKTRPVVILTSEFALV